ncbi:MAG: helix-turn-helix transcriptional regulator [Thermoflavifilum sp.]|nr:helix-turn-helix transcriptional regulator [Thermoflavifilum sp.]MCL6513226.1 helix-turn-helix domain-containing protein [Alicyclobacillus sp.]
MLDVFGRRLRAYRKLKQLTQTELAEVLGVSVAMVGGLERGTRSPTPDLVKRICAALDVTEDELWGRRGLLAEGRESAGAGDAADDAHWDGMR